MSTPGGYQPYPPPGPPGGPTSGGFAGPPAQVLVTVGDISCTQTEVIIPSGRAPLQGTAWTVTNQVTSVEKIPTWAVVVAIVGMLVICLFSLFFLLVKERSVQGYVHVTVQAPGFYHTTQIPVNSDFQIRDIDARVNYIRSLVAALG